MAATQDRCAWCPTELTENNRRTWPEELYGLTAEHREQFCSEFGLACLARELFKSPRLWDCSYLCEDHYKLALDTVASYRCLPAARIRQLLRHMPWLPAQREDVPSPPDPRPLESVERTAATEPRNSSPSSAPTGGLPTVKRSNPNFDATWYDLPVLEVNCQQLSTAEATAARGANVGMHENRGGSPIRLRIILPVYKQHMPAWEVWDRHIDEIAKLLISGEIHASALELRMAGGAAWKHDKDVCAVRLHRIMDVLVPRLLEPLRKLGSAAASPIRHLDVELPLSVETLKVLSVALPGITSLRLDNLIPPLHNQVQILPGIHAFPALSKLDVAVISHKQVQHLAHFTQLTELRLRYCMWSIPELSPLADLQQLSTFDIEVLDDRARFQLDFLRPLVTSLPRLRHLRAVVILSRTVISEGGCDFLEGCDLQTLRLDVRVPQDAVHTVQEHFRDLHRAPRGCKVYLTIRADALSCGASVESAAGRTAQMVAPCLGMAWAGAGQQAGWGVLNLSYLGNGHPPDALSLLHLRGCHSALSRLPDLSVARLTRLQISNARLGPTDFAALSACTSLEHLFMRFKYAPGSAPGNAAGALALPGSRNVLGVNGGGGGTTANNGNSVAGNGTGNSAGSARSSDNAEGGFGGSAPSGGSAHVTGIKPCARAAGGHAMVTRSKTSLLASGRLAAGTENSGSGPSALGGGRAAAVVAPCVATPVPYALQPLLQLTSLCSLELLEECEEGIAAPGGAAVRTLSTADAAAVAAAASDAAGASAAASPADEQLRSIDQRSSLFTCKSALARFLQNLAHVPQLASLSLSLLAEATTLPDCPCKTSCFSRSKRGSKGAAKAQPPPSLRRPLDSEGITEMLTGAAPESAQKSAGSSCSVDGAAAAACRASRQFRVALGSMVAESGGWHRPTAWPQLED